MYNSVLVDTVTMGLPNDRDVAFLMVSSGVTLENLFDGTLPAEEAETTLKSN